MRVFLKRSCTEMELAAGPSDQWRWDEKFAMDEDLINSIFVHPPKPGLAPKFVEVNVMAGWIFWAATNGVRKPDETYLEFVDRPLPMILKPVEYQDSIHNEKDFPLVGRKETLAWARKEEECKSCQEERLISRV
jgi:hypothetical protein